MVKSVLNPSITYPEEKGISIEDVDKDGQLYEYDIKHGVTIHLAVGNYRYDHATDKNIIYFPIYLVKDGEKIVICHAKKKHLPVVFLQFVRRVGVWSRVFVSDGAGEIIDYYSKLQASCVRARCSSREWVR